MKSSYLLAARNGESSPGDVGPGSGVVLLDGTLVQPNGFYRITRRLRSKSRRVVDRLLDLDGMFSLSLDRSEFQNIDPNSNLFILLSYLLIFPVGLLLGCIFEITLFWT
jgi:hypothetical protein